MLPLNGQQSNDENRQTSSVDLIMRVLFFSRVRPSGRSPLWPHGWHPLRGTSAIKTADPPATSCTPTRDPPPGSSLFTPLDSLASPGFPLHPWSHSGIPDRTLHKGPPLPPGVFDPPPWPPPPHPQGRYPPVAARSDHSPQPGHQAKTMQHETKHPLLLLFLSFFR